MLPVALYGPGKAIAFESHDACLLSNHVRFPGLDPDYILQVCFEHPARLDAILPQFDARRHVARRVVKTAGWVYENVRHDDNRDVDFWFEHFDSQLHSGRSDYEVFNHMVKHGEWPFPPVVVEASLAASLGAPSGIIGKPFHLVEGTHRVSYLRRMIQLGLTPRERCVVLIEVAE